MTEISTETRGEMWHLVYNLILSNQQVGKVDRGEVGGIARRDVGTHPTRFTFYCWGERDSVRINAKGCVPFIIHILREFPKRRVVGGCQNSSVGTGLFFEGLRSGARAKSRQTRTAAGRQLARSFVNIFFFFFFFKKNTSYRKSCDGKPMQRMNKASWVTKHPPRSSRA